MANPPGHLTETQKNWLPPLAFLEIDAINLTEQVRLIVRASGQDFNTLLRGWATLHRMTGPPIKITFTDSIMGFAVDKYDPVSGTVVPITDPADCSARIILWSVGKTGRFPDPEYPNDPSKFITYKPDIKVDTDQLDLKVVIFGSGPGFQAHTQGTGISFSGMHCQVKIEKIRVTGEWWKAYQKLLNYFPAP